VIAEAVDAEFQMANPALQRAPSGVGVLPSRIYSSQATNSLTRCPGAQARGSHATSGGAW